MNEEKVSLRLRGDLEVLYDIEQLLEENDHSEVLAFDTEQDSAGADFDVTLIATLVGLVSDLFFDGPIIPALTKIFRKKPGTKISIETPQRSIVIESSPGITEEEVRKIMKILVLCLLTYTRAASTLAFLA
jgi:hypothetical protein